MHEHLNGVEPEPTSLEHVKRSDVFPKKLLVSDDDNLRVPFPVLSGESAEFIGRTADGIVVLSNFRLFIRYKESFINVPLGLIESLETRDIFYIHIYCKDATVVRCAFSTNETCQEWFKRLALKMVPRQKYEEVFAFAFHAWCGDRNVDRSMSFESSPPSIDGCYQLCSTDKPNPYSFTKELERLKFDMNKAWRYTEINKQFGLCSTYPSEHIVPKSVTDDNLKKVGGFRALQRFPTVVWRNCRTGAVLVRSSQPEMGFFGWRNTDDENLLSAIPKACALNPGSHNKHCHREDSIASDVSSDDSSIAENGVEVLDEPKKMLIIDCRSYGAAFANRAKGGGVECPEYYQSCEIQFMNLANIHAIRKSFVAVRLLCSNNPDQASWLSGLENTKWLHNMASLLKAAALVVSANDKEGRPVLVHCSDGWDRTPQIISLAELMMDPFYRTVEGFQILIEREWLHFGHKFADRCGNGIHADDVNERCPVFLQWLECVHQLLRQFPCQFEFNEAFLVKLVQHTYSCLFGTFLCNSMNERITQKIDMQCASVWCLLNDKKFVNHLYEPSSVHEVLYPATHVKSLHLWEAVYLSNNSSFAGPEDTATQNIANGDPSETPGLQKTRSCENLCMNDLNSSLSRRKSDPNIAMDHCEQQTQKLLKDAMSGDTSCSSESVKSSENTSFSDTGETTIGLDSPVSNGHADLEGKETENGEVSLEGSKVNDDETNGNAETVTENGIENGEQDKEETNVSDENKPENTDSVKEIEPLHVMNGIDTGTIEKGESYMNGVDDKGQGHKDCGNSETVSEEHTSDHLQMNGYVGKYECNGIDIKNKKEHFTLNGGDIHQMNGHSDGDNDNNLSISPDDSSGNSIETISETEDNTIEESDTGNIHNLNGAYSVAKTENGTEVKIDNSTKKCDNAVTQNGFELKIDTNKFDMNKALLLKQKQRQQFSVGVAGGDKVPPSLESSTDTVTEEVQHSDSNHTLTPSQSYLSNGHVSKVASLQSLCDKANTSLFLNSSELTTSISTSTSDLTDSRIQHNGSIRNGLGVPCSMSYRDALLNGEDTQNTSQKLRCMLGQAGLFNGNVSGSQKGGAGIWVDTTLTPPHYPTPISPLSRNSTCPPTPGTNDSKSLDIKVPKPQSGVGRHLDVDGLTIFNDPVQRHIEAMQSRHELEVNTLKDEVLRMKAILAQHEAACNGEGACSLGFKIGNESPGSCDMASIQSNYSNAASDASWDQVDDPEANITRWVPDHLVTQCAGCDIAFSIIKRKHHCRNCGLIFCHNCCSDTMPLPHQMIHTEQRVCQGCYRKVTNFLTRSIIELDNSIGEQLSPMAAAASN